MFFTPKNHKRTNRYPDFICSYKALGIRGQFLQIRYIEDSVTYLYVCPFLLQDLHFNV